MKEIVIGLVVGYFIVTLTMILNSLNSIKEAQWTAYRIMKDRADRALEMWAEEQRNRAGPEYKINKETDDD